MVVDSTHQTGGQGASLLAGASEEGCGSLLAGPISLGRLVDQANLASCPELLP